MKNPAADLTRSEMVMLRAAGMRYLPSKGVWQDRDGNPFDSARAALARAHALADGRA